MTVRSTSDATFTVHQGDSRHLGTLLSRLSSPDEPLITTTITSPPYADLKDYGTPDQIGFGQPYDEYLADCRRVFRSLHSHTRTDGSLWLIADTMRTSQSDNGVPWALRPVPFDLAEEATKAGWTLRDTIIWRKNKTLPWSGRGRLRNSFEYILFFVKSTSFKYEVDRLRETERLEQWWVKWPERYHPAGKVPGNVWDIDIPTQGAWREPAIQHACPLPPELVRRLVLLSSDEGDVVFDPFAGTGTVVGEAMQLGRRGLGVELNPEYVEAWQKVVRPALVTEQLELIEDTSQDADYLSDTLLKLRGLKFAVVLEKEARKRGAGKATATIMLQQRGAGQGHRRGEHELVSGRTAIVVAGDDVERGRYQRVVNDLIGRPPASKMGVGGPVEVIAPTKAMKWVMRNSNRKTLSVYPSGRFWMADGKVKLSQINDLVSPGEANGSPLLLSDVLVQQEPRAWTGSAE